MEVNTINSTTEHTTNFAPPTTEYTRTSKIYDSFNFWRDSNNTYRTTNTGMNQYILHHIKSMKHRRFYHYSDIDSLCRYDKKIARNFEDTINECLRRIYQGEYGYVFSKEQSKAVKLIIQNVRIKRSCNDGCFICWLD